VGGWLNSNIDHPYYLSFFLSKVGTGDEFLDKLLSTDPGLEV